MTREELEEKAQHYTDCVEKEYNIPERIKRLIKSAYIVGASEYPVWHNASEEPQSNHKNIIYQTNYRSMYNVHIDFIPTCLRSCKITSRSWDEFVKEVNMRRWAYINDLLPKQFGNK